jgi:hypothetical protein
MDDNESVGSMRIVFGKPDPDELRIPSIGTSAVKATAVINPPR